MEVEEPPDGWVPPELHHCPPALLESYVRRRIQVFNAHPALAQRLGRDAAAALQAATADLLAQEGVPVDGETTARPLVSNCGPRELHLAFRHDCRHPSCCDAACTLCAQSQARRCTRVFSAKYLCGDTIKAACGAAIRLELVDGVTGRVVRDHTAIQLSLVDGRGYAELASSAASGAPSDADLDRVTLATNQQGQLLLAAKGGSSYESDRVVVALADGSAQLPDLSVTGSSEALLSGQKPPFALLATALDAGSGERRADIPPAASDGFVVATQRVRTAAKKDVPHLSDHVSKIACVGAATQSKLADLAKAAADAGVQGLQAPLPSVTTVGEFRQLVEWAVQQPLRCDRVRRMLKLQKGWEEAREHVMRAVGSDSRLRAFFADDSRTAGLLFRCQGAVPELEAPLALLAAAMDSTGRPTLLATLLESIGPAQQQAEQAQQPEHCVPPDSVCTAQAAGLEEAGRRVKAVLRQAKACWALRGHPGWAIVPMDTEAFEAGCHRKQVLLDADIVAVAVPPVLHSGAVSVRPPVQQTAQHTHLMLSEQRQQQRQQQQQAGVEASQGQELPPGAAMVAASGMEAMLALRAPPTPTQAASSFPAASPTPPSPYTHLQAAAPPGMQLGTTGGTSTAMGPPFAGAAVPAGSGSGALARRRRIGSSGTDGAGSSGLLARAEGSLSAKLLQSIGSPSAMQGRPAQQQDWAAPAEPGGARALHMQLAPGTLSMQLSPHALGVTLPVTSFHFASQPANQGGTQGQLAAPQPVPAAVVSARLPALPAAAPAGQRHLQAAAPSAPDAPQTVGVTSPRSVPAPTAPSGGAVLAPAAQVSAQPAASAPIDWAQLLLEAYKPDVPGAPSGTGLPMPGGGANPPALHAPAPAHSASAALLNALTRRGTSAAAQELAATLRSVSSLDWSSLGMDWEQALASLESLPSLPEGTGAAGELLSVQGAADLPAAAAGVGAGDGGGEQREGARTPLPLDWSKLLSLCASDWAAVLQDLQSQPGQQHAQQEQCGQQDGRAPQSQGQLARQAQQAGQQGGQQQLGDAGQVASQDFMLPDLPLQAGVQPPAKGDRKRTLSKLTPLNSGI